MKKIKIKTKGVLRVDLGCGSNKKAGFLGFDIKKEKGVDYVCDLSKGIPLEDNSVDEVFTSHFLEHVEDYNFMMKEIIRVCKNKAKVEIVLPYYSYIGAVLHSHKDNPHRHIFSEAYFYWKDVNPCFDNYEIEDISYKFINYNLFGKGLKNFIFYFIYKYLFTWDIKRVHFLNSVEEFKIVLRIKK